MKLPRLSTPIRVLLYALLSAVIFLGFWLGGMYLGRISNLPDALEQMAKSPTGQYTAKSFYRDENDNFLTLQAEDSPPEMIIRTKSGWIQGLSWQKKNILVVDYSGNLESYPKTWRHEVAIFYHKIEIKEATSPDEQKTSKP